MGFADARLAVDRHTPRAARRKLLESPVELPQLAVAPDRERVTGFDVHGAKSLFGSGCGFRESPR